MAQPSTTSSQSSSLQAPAPSTPVAASPFTSGPTPTPRGFWSRLFRLARPDDAYQAIVNRLAATQVGEVGSGEISADLLAFGVTGKSARDVLLRVWRQAMKSFLADDQITDGEQTYLVGLRHALALRNEELEEVEEELVEPRFAHAVGEAVADGKLTGQKRARLDSLSKALRLSPEVASRILDDARQKKLQGALEEAIADERLSPTETADLHALAAALGATISVDARTQRTLDRYSLMWRIENGQLPVESVPIHLQRGEQCHASASATWYEMRTRTERVNYGGPVVSIPICKGVRYRVGSVHVEPIRHDVLTAVDTGTLYVTNKRVIFDGSRRNTSIRFSSLLSYTPYVDGVKLEKSSGKPMTMVLGDTDVEIFNMILGEVLSSA